MKSKVTVEITTLTPELAQKLLEANINNRTVSDTTVARYARDMKAGRWTESNDAVCVGEDGTLYNGQHRCWAVFQSGVSIPIVIQRGMSDASRMNMDSGNKRHVGDNLTMTTGEKNGRRLIELSSTIHYLVTKRTSASPGEKLELLERHRKGIDWVERAYAEGASSKRAGLGASCVRAALAFAYDTDPAKVDAFTRRLVTGVGEFKEGDPVLALQSAVMNSTGASRRILAVKTLRACLAFIRGEKIKTGSLYATEEAVVFFGKKFGYVLEGVPGGTVPTKLSAPKRRVLRAVEAGR